MDSAADLHGVACTLSHHHHVVGGARQTGPANLLDNIPVKIQLFFRNQNGGGPCGNPHGQRQIAGVAAHDLHHGAALVGLHGVPQPVDALNTGVAGGVKANGIVGAANIVVNGGGNTGHLQLIPRLLGPAGQLQRPPEGAVAANGHNGVQAQQAAGGQGLVLTGHGPELIAAGGIQEGAAPVDDVADAGCIHVDKITVDQAVPASADADAADALAHGGPYDGADSGVHARRVAAACQNAYTFYLLLHMLPPNIIRVAAHKTVGPLRSAFL